MNAFLSVLALGELGKGIEQIRGRDPQQAESLDLWLQDLLRFLASRIISIEAEVADRWGALDSRRTFPVIDSLLAATALVHGLTLVTRNAREVAGTGAAVLDPFA